MATLLGFIASSPNRAAKEGSSDRIATSQPALSFGGFVVLGQNVNNTPTDELSDGGELSIVKRLLLVLIPNPDLPLRRQNGVAY